MDSSQERIIIKPGHVIEVFIANRLIQETRDKNLRAGRGLRAGGSEYKTKQALNKTKQALNKTPLDLIPPKCHHHQTTSNQSNKKGVWLLRFIVQFIESPSDLKCPSLHLPVGPHSMNQDRKDHRALQIL